MDKFNKYPKTDKFRAVNTVTLPHEYCIEAKHVQYAAYHHDSEPNRTILKAYEHTHGPSCVNPGCTLSIDEHIPSLLIEVDSKKTELKNEPGLEEYLQSCEEQMRIDGLKGFSFIKKIHRRKAPWKDFKGNIIREGDSIKHPDGTIGKVFYVDVHEDEFYNWRVEYNKDENDNSTLRIQIGDKGQAVVIKENN